MQRQAQILSRNQETDRPVKNLPCNHHEGKQQDRSHILPQQRRFDQHADRHEKNRPEEVFDRRHHFFDRFGFGGPGQYRAHYERAEGRRKADRIGQHDHTEAQAQRNDQQRLGIEQPPYAPQQRRDQVNRHNEPRNEEKEQFEQPSCNIRLFDVLLHVKGRKQHEQHHGEQVFDDQYAEHLPGKFAVTQAQVVERLDDDRGRGHGQHAAEENTVGRGPVQHASGHKAGAHHPGDDHHRRHQRRAAHLHQFIEAELEPERKEQEDDADLGPDIHVIHVRHPFEQEIPAAKESGDDVAQHDRLFQFFEQQCNDTRHAQNQREVGNQRIKVCHLSDSDLEVRDIPMRNRLCTTPAQHTGKRGWKAGCTKKSPGASELHCKSSHFRAKCTAP